MSLQLHRFRKSAEQALVVSLSHIAFVLIDDLVAPGSCCHEFIGKSDVEDHQYVPDIFMHSKGAIRDEVRAVADVGHSEELCSAESLKWIEVED